jgi:hypothetical protein
MPLTCSAKTVEKSVQLAGCNDKGGTNLQTATKLTWIIAGIATVQPSLLERGLPAKEVLGRPDAPLRLIRGQASLQQTSTIGLNNPPAHCMRVAFLDQNVVRNPTSMLRPAAGAMSRRIELA